MIARPVTDAVRREAEQLARLHATFPEQITSIHTDARGQLSAVGIGTDSDGLARYALNFDL